MRTHVLMASLVAVLAAAAPAANVQPRSREKVILDTDFTTAGDDGMVGIMAAQLHAQGAIELLGITVVAGNEWLQQEVADALRAVERLGIADTSACMRARDIRSCTITGRSRRSARCGASEARGTAIPSQPTVTSSHRSTGSRPRLASNRSMRWTSSSTASRSTLTR